MCAGGGVAGNPASRLSQSSPDFPPPTSTGTPHSPRLPATDFEPASSLGYAGADGLHCACEFHTHPPRSQPMREKDDRPIGRANVVGAGESRLIPWIWEGVV